MIGRSFKSVLWVATVGGAALGCYMVSLKVATERADLGKVERQIVSAQRNIRSLQTELGTRGRLAQLEDWNANVLALSAPAANQFLPDHLTLARLEQHEATVEERGAEVHMAAAQTGPAASPAPARSAAAPKPMPAQPAAREPALKMPKLIRAAQPVGASPASLIHKASFASAPAEPARAAKSARLDSIASEIGAAARADRSEQSGRERGTGTR
jgi:hypothetical protein